MNKTEIINLLQDLLEDAKKLDNRCMTSKEWNECELFLRAESAENKEDADKKAWEQFESITSAHGGKQMYFLEDDRKTVYSRWSHRRMTPDEALDEFLDMIGDS